MTPSLRLSFPGRVCRSVPCRHRLPPRSACAQWLRSHTPRPQKKNGKSHFRNQQNLILRMSHKRFCDPNDSSLIFENVLSFEFFLPDFPHSEKFFKTFLVKSGGSYGWHQRQTTIAPKTRLSNCPEMHGKHRPRRSLSSCFLLQITCLHDDFNIRLPILGSFNLLPMGRMTPNFR